MFYEKTDPAKGLDGIFECFLQRTVGIQDVVQAHIHDHFELLYCTGGSFELIVEKQPMVLSVGDAVLIRPMQPHQTRTFQGGVNQYIVMKFMPEGLFSSAQPMYELKYIFPFIYASKQEIEFYTRDALKGSRIQGLLQALLDEAQRRAYGYEMAMRSYTEQILLWFIRKWYERGKAEPMDAFHLQVIKAVFLYLDEHPGEELTVSQLARRFNMGRSTFSRFFSRYAGESLPSYVRRLRLTKAANLLAQTDKSVTEIASETGFSTTSYFVLCFREQNGLTPKQFHMNAVRMQERAEGEGEREM